MVFSGLSVYKNGGSDFKSQDNNMYTKHKFNLPKHWTLDLAEEVGVDIAEAIAVLDIAKKRPKKLAKKVDFQAEKFDRKEKAPNDRPASCLRKSSSFKRIKSFGQFTADILPRLKHSVKILRDENFVNELKNEVQNAPQSSSTSLSRFLKLSSPTTSKNIMFKDSVTVGHSQGKPETCCFKLTPQVLTFHVGHKTQHIILEDIQLVQLDEFHQICTIYAANTTT